MLYLVLEWDKYKQKLNYCTNNNKFCQASENQDYIKRETETLLSVSLIINLFYARLWVKASAEDTNIIVKNTISRIFLHFEAILVG